MEKKNRGKIAARVEEICRRPVEEAGYLLWDVDYYKEGADYNLLVTIENVDREKPVDLDDCEKVSRLLSPLLDQEDPIEASYYLEVSSPGLERNLTRPEHFTWSLGRSVTVRLYAPRDGKKSLTGTLVSFDGDRLTIKTGDENITLSQDAVAKVTAAQDLS